MCIILIMINIICTNINKEIQILQQQETAQDCFFDLFAYHLERIQRTSKKTIVYISIPFKITLMSLQTSYHSLPFLQFEDFSSYYKYSIHSIF